jgi:hypothetical protein
VVVEVGVNMLESHFLALVFLVVLVVVESKDLVVEREIEKLEHQHLSHHKEMMVDQAFLNQPILVVGEAAAQRVLEDLEILLLVDPVVKDHPRFMLMGQQIQ